MFYTAKTFSVHRRVRNHYTKRILNLILNRKQFLWRGNDTLDKQKPRQNPLPRQIQRATPSPQISSTLRGGSSPPFLQYVIPTMYLPLSVKVANIKPIPRLNHISTSASNGIPHKAKNTAMQNLVVMGPIPLCPYFSLSFRPYRVDNRQRRCRQTICIHRNICRRVRQ